MDLQEEVNSLEKQLLELISKKLEENKIEVDKAQELARDFLAILPVSDQEDLLKKLQDLSGKYEEVKPLYIHEYAKMDEVKRDEVLTHMRNSIHTGNIEQAIEIAKVYSAKKGSI
jgi:hypothetical protein